jgi:hypothetical protein
MKFSWFWFIDIGLYFLYSMLKPKKQPEEAPKKFEVPDTTIGTPIPVLFGKRPIKNPILVEYGHVRIIKEQVDPQGKK